MADFCRRRSWSSDRVPLFEYRSFFVDWGNANVRSLSLILFDSSSPVCCAVNYVRSAANFAAANWGRVHVSMYVNDQGGLYICRYRPPVHNESSAQEERNPSTQLPITQPNHQLSPTHRSAHQDVQGLDGGISYTPASPRLRQGFIFTLLYLKRKWIMI